MKSATWRVAALVATAALIGVSPAVAARAWDAGESIDGDLQDKDIEIAASCEDGDSTDTLSWTGGDNDHWIEGNQSEPDDEGSPSDALGGWEEGVKCWWTTTHGTVTQYSLTTVWTAPYKQGVDSIVEIGVVDLPLAVPPGETGTRDDPGREYFGTPEERLATAYWLTWHANTSGSTHGNPQFNFNWTQINPCGNGTQLGIVDPDTPNCDGFYKKVELVGVLSPPRQGIALQLRQWYGELTYLNGQVYAQVPEWAADSTAMQTTTDASGKVYIWDGPGSLMPNGGWSKSADWVSYEQEMSFLDKAFLSNGDRISDPCNWHRSLHLSGTQGSYSWNKPPVTNQ